MKILTLILATTIALGSSAMAQNNDEARGRAERSERDERGERGERDERDERSERSERSERDERDERGDRGNSDARTAFREKLGALVEAGKITREEAVDLYRTAFPERSTARRQYENKRVKEVKAPDLFNKGVQNPIFSGPQPGEKLVSFQAVGYAGEHKEQMLDPIAMANNRPHLIVFQDDEGASSRGLYDLSGSLATIGRKSDVDLHVSVILLSDDPVDFEPYAGMFPALLERGVDVIAFSKEGREGPGAYGLDRTVSQTFVLAKGGKVVHNLVFPKGGVYADSHVLGGIADIIGEKRETVQAWLNQETTGGREMRRR